MDDNDELEFVEEDYYAFLNVPRNVSFILIYHNPSQVRLRPLRQMVPQRNERLFRNLTF